MSELLTTLVANIRPFVPGCPDFNITPEVRRAYIDFCRRTHFLTKDFTVEVTTSDPDTYSNDQITVSTAGVMNGYRPIFVHKLFVDTAEYKVSSHEVVTDATYLTSILESGTKFYSIKHDNSIVFFPFSDMDETVELYISAAFQPHDDVTDMPDIIYDEWHEVIEARALSRLLRLPKTAWNDRNESDIKKVEYAKGISKARSQKNLKQGGGEVMVEMRQFV